MKVEQLQRAISNISIIICNAMPDAIGEPGCEADPDSIIYAANRLIEIYHSIIIWSLDFNTIITETDFNGLAKSFSKMCEVTLCDIENFSSDLCQKMEAIPDILSENVSPTTVKITLSLRSPNTDDFEKELSKIRANFRLEIHD